MTAICLFVLRFEAVSDGLIIVYCSLGLLITASFFHVVYTQLVLYVKAFQSIILFIIVSYFSIVKFLLALFITPFTQLWRPMGVQFLIWLIIFYLILMNFIGINFEFELINLSLSDYFAVFFLYGVKERRFDLWPCGAFDSLRNELFDLFYSLLHFVAVAQQW